LTEYIEVIFKRALLNIHDIVGDILVIYHSCG